MLKRFFISTLATLSFMLTTANAEIIETKHVADILPSVEENTLVLFNIAEVLTDSEISLGSSPWRQYLRSKKATLPNRPNCSVHDALTWLVFNQVPHRPVEPNTPGLIKELQQDGIAVAAFTSRGKSEWYTTNVQGVDTITESVLASLDINFINSSLPFVFIQVEGSSFLAHYRNGIFYSDHMEKGDFLKQLLQDSGHLPKNVVFVDDKLDSLKSVEAALNELNIPFQGFWYTRTKENYKNFSPMVAHVQLDVLIKEGKIVSDHEAQMIIDRQYPDVNPDVFFFELLEHIDFSSFPDQK